MSIQLKAIIPVKYEHLCGCKFERERLCCSYGIRGFTALSIELNPEAIVWVQDTPVEIVLARGVKVVVR